MPRDFTNPKFNKVRTPGDWKVLLYERSLGEAK